MGVSEKPIRLQDLGCKVWVEGRQERNFEPYSQAYIGFLLLPLLLLLTF